MQTQEVDQAEAILDEAVTAARAGYVAARPKSAAAHAAACEVLPGGNTRSVLHFDPFPFRVVSASGAEVTDLDGHRYVDLCGNYSAGLLGHNPESVKQAVIDVLETGWTIGATHEREAELARRICDRFPSIDQVRFTNSGTEANLMAIGTALHHVSLTSPDRRTIGVFEHGYHGGVLSFGQADAHSHNPLNVPHDFHVSVFDDVAGLDALFAKRPACVLIEPVQGAGGCRPASIDFLTELRRRCDEAGTILIFDEVMSSRMSPGGAQERFGVLPDMSTLGKYLGGGMTFGAFGGRADLMAEFDPSVGGALTQAGTFNNNVVTMAAGIAALDHELDPDEIRAVNDRGDRLLDDLNAAFAESGAPLRSIGYGSLVAVHAADDRHMELFFHHVLSHGIYIARRGFMALSKAVTDADTARLVELARNWNPPD